MLKKERDVDQFAICAIFALFVSGSGLLGAGCAKEMKWYQRNVDLEGGAQNAKIAWGFREENS